MQRKDFIRLVTATAAMSTLNSLKSFGDSLKTQETTMPLLFVGHGSPMNGIEDNEFSRRWSQMGKELPLLKAVLCISAHWLTEGTLVTAMEQPKTIHDFGGFPQALFDVQYPAPGDPLLARQTAQLVHNTQVGLDHEWGLDHGTWSVVKQMYPQANIPVLQLSIHYSKPAQFHYNLAKELAALRKKGVLIIGSGNMVHNLRMVQWDGPPEFGFDWTLEMNEKFKKAILSNDHQSLINYHQFGAAGKNAIPTPDHYFPLLYIMGLKEPDENISFFNDKAVMGSITMTSVKISS